MVHVLSNSLKSKLDKYKLLFHFNPANTNMITAIVANSSNIDKAIEILLEYSSDFIFM